MMEYLKRLINKDGALFKLLVKVLNRLPFNNKFKLNGNECKIETSLLRHCEIIIEGRGNTIIIGNRCRLSNCSFQIQGSNNTIVLSDSVLAMDVEFHIEDNDNRIEVGPYTSFYGKSLLACIEGCTLSIGEGCLLSDGITFRTGDSHSILNMDGVRVNPSQDIIIGKHVWIGHKASINKGARIAADSIVGTGAIVTKPFEQPNVIIAGVPAKIIKENINWKSKRIPILGDNK